MAGTLVVAEHRQGRVRDVTFELLGAARELGGPVAVAVIAAEPQPLADALDVAGVDEILLVRSPGDEYAADTYVAAIEALVRERRPSLVLCGFTVDGMGFAPAVAARLELGFASDVISVRREGGAVVAEREFYGGKVRGEVVFPGREAVLLMLRPTVWPAAEGPGSAAVVAAELALEEPRTRHVELIEPVEEGFDITRSDFILSVGRGVGEQANLSQFETLAGRMGADLGVSRPLVDAGWAPSARQVGQSGKTVKPRVYLAFGISGAVQHLAGMKTSGRIIAVNSDPEAAIFNVAHYGAAADIFDVAAELEKLY